MKLYNQHQLPSLYIDEKILNLNNQPLWRQYFPNGGVGYNYAHVVCRKTKTNGFEEIPPPPIFYFMNFPRIKWKEIFVLENNL